MRNKTQFVIILGKYEKWAYYNFPNTFNWYLTTQMSRTTNKKLLARFYEFICFSTFCEIIKFFFFIRLRYATLESKAAHTNRNSSAILLNTSKSCPNVEFLFTLHKLCLELIFATEIQTMLLKQPVVLLTSCQKKYCVYYVSEHFKYYTQINEYWLNKSVCLNIMLEAEIKCNNHMSSNRY